MTEEKSKKKEKCKIINAIPTNSCKSNAKTFNCNRPLFVVVKSISRLRSISWQPFLYMFLYDLRGLKIFYSRCVYTAFYYYNNHIVVWYDFQLYTAGNETDRRSFLDSLFSYMQEQGESNQTIYNINVLLFYCFMRVY
jgi:hypothetical protein